jgi:hypothetical protein
MREIGGFCQNRGGEIPRLPESLLKRAEVARFNAGVHPRIRQPPHVADGLVDPPD